MLINLHTWPVSNFQTLGQWLIVTFIFTASCLYLWQINKFHDENQQFITERDQYLLEKAQSNLSLLFDELKRDVILLAQSHQESIERLVADPEEQHVYDQLLFDIKDIFPEVFTVTIANSDGKAIIENFDGFIQQVCENDLSSFAMTKSHPDIYIHPNPFLYHFDLMTEIMVANKEYIFFVSFDSSIIANSLKNSITPGYQLLLVHNEIDDLIEVTTQGSRDILDGNNILKEEQQMSLVGEIDVPRTKWRLLILNAGDNTQERYKISPENQFWPIILFNIFCIISLFVLQLLKKRIKGQEILLEEKTNDLSFSREHLLALFTSVLDAIITIDKNSIITAFNPAAEHMFGYSSKEILGKNMKLLIPDQFHSEHDDFMNTYLENTDTEIISNTRKALGLKRNGDTFPTELSVSDIKFHDKIEFVAIIRDITQRTYIEKIKTEFISTVSHEMRTPLTSIRGSLSLMASGKVTNLNPKAERVITIALNNTDRLIKLINEILIIDRMESGNMLFYFEDVSLKSVITDSIDNVQGLADEKSIEIDFRCLCDNTTIRADKGRMIQVVVNLLSNAIKFSHQQGSSVLIILDCDEENCTFSIKDKGVGIRQQDHESIFKKFSQVDSSDTRYAGGSGLGLCIVKSIIDAHNGSIELESQPGAGSTFIIKLRR